MKRLAELWGKAAAAIVAFLALFLWCGVIAAASPCIQFQAGGYFFDDYENVEYVNGFLVYHFKLKTPYNDGRSFFTVINFFSDECQHGTVNAPSTLVNLTPGVQFFSIRFTSRTHFDVWNDETNTMETCGGCSRDTPLFPEYYEAQFSAGIDGASTLTSTSYRIDATAADAPLKTETLPAPTNCQPFQVGGFGPYFFDNYERAEYINDLLTYRFRLKTPYNDGRNWRFATLFHGEDCSERESLVLSPSPVNNIWLTPFTRYYSVRFSSTTHFDIWNDETEQIEICSTCSVDIPATLSNGEPYTFVSFLGVIDGGASSFHSTPFSILDLRSPALDVTPSVIDFGVVPVNGSATFDLAVRNTGGQTLVGSCTIAAPFSLPSGCSFNLSAGQSVLVPVRFTPALDGVFKANAEFTSNGGGGSSLAKGGGTTEPHVNVVSPGSGLPGAVVVISGFNFGASRSGASVKFGSKAARINRWSGAEVEIAVPVLTPGEYVVVVATTRGTSNAVAFAVLGPPSITELNPATGTEGKVVTILGANFGGAAGSVTFGGTPAAISSWTNKTVKAVAPSGGVGVVPVTITTALGTSNSVDFTYTGPAETPIRLVRTSDVGRNIGLKFVVKRKTAEEFVVDLKLSNGRRTWLFVRREGNLSAPDCLGGVSTGCVPFIFMLGPLQEKTFSELRFPRGTFVEFRASKAGIFGVDQLVPLTVVAMDLGLRGFFGAELDPATFDSWEGLLPLAGVVANEVGEELAELAGEFAAKRVHYLPIAMLKFAGDLDYNDPVILEFIQALQSINPLMAKWVDFALLGIEELIQIVEFPEHLRLLLELREGTANAAQEGVATLMAR